MKESSIAWLEWDQVDSSVNLLSFSFMEEFQSVLKEIEKEKPKALVFLSKKPHVFCAGADIKEIQKMKTTQEVENTLNKAHELFCWFKTLNFTKIVAIQGSCLGGGLELALYFDYRLVADSSHIQLALPEVQLGLIPGFGGCLHLPRLIGLKKSLNMILTGKSLNIKQARKIGLVDEIVPALLLEKKALDCARNFKKETKNKYKDLKPYSFYIEKIFKPIICFLAKNQVLNKTKGFYPAPLKALKVIQKTYGNSISNKELEIEKQAFCESFQTSESKNLIHVFTMINQAKKINLQTESRRKKTIEHIGVLGAGLMGRSIAYLFTNKGFKVRLIDNNEQQLCNALAWTNKLFHQQKKRGKISSYELKQKRNNLSVSTKFWGFSSLDLVIEALPENKKLKQKIITDVSKKLSPDCLFASNSSSLRISDLSQCSLYPENFFGFHFFNPAERMPLVEISLTEKQKEFPLNSLLETVKKIGKIPLFVKDTPGFIVNRLLVIYLTEALLLYKEGYDIQHVDHCYRDQFGLPLGPFELMDKVGLDICIEVLFQLSKETQLNLEPASWMLDLPKQLGLGKKTGTGFYIYNNKSVSVNEKNNSLQRTNQKEPILDEKIIERGIFRIINEGKNMIQSHIVEKEEDIDLALILGMGFPPFLGGPMNYAKKIGLSKVRTQLENFKNQYGQRFKPHF